MKEKPVSPMSFSAALTGYRLNVEARGLSDCTIRDYWNTFRKFAEYIEEDLPFDQITTDHVEGFLADQEEISNKTLLNYHTGLAALWTWAVKKNLASHNILHDVERPKPEARAIVPFSEMDVRSILEALIYSKQYARPGKRACRNKLAHADRNRAVVLLLLDTGMRATELCSLKVNHVDFRNRHLKVFGKGAKERELPFSARTGEALWKYVSSRRDDRVTSPLIISDRGNPMNRINLLHMMERASARSGVKDVHPHRFRHTFAINYLRNGGDAYSLQDMLGHATMEMVRTYLKLAQVDLDRVHRIASPVDNWRL